MKQAVREFLPFNNGLGSPIECHRISSSKSGSGEVPAPHYHEHIEFLYADGECDLSVWIAGKTVDFHTDDLLIISSNAAHTFINRLPKNSYICIKALPEMIYSVDNSFFDMKYVLPFFGKSFESYQLFKGSEVRDTEIPETFAQVLSEWTEQGYGYELSLKSLLLKIFLWTVRYNHSRTALPLPSFGDDYLDTVRIIQRSVEYVNENYADTDEKEVASKFNMSYSHYSRQFKRVMGRSFCEYLTLTRINAAERLLLSSEMSVTEIAFATGFATSSHFIDRFKRVKGITPSKYRQIGEKNRIEDLNKFS